MVRSGKSRVEVAEAVGVNRRFVGEWVRAFETAGQRGLAAGLEGAAGAPASKRPCPSGKRP